MAQMIEMDSLNDEMQGELSEVKLFQCEHQQEQVKELQENYSRSAELVCVCVCVCAGMHEHASSGLCRHYSKD